MLWPLLYAVSEKFRKQFAKALHGLRWEVQVSVLMLVMRNAHLALIPAVCEVLNSCQSCRCAVKHQAKLQHFAITVL